jgi:hypothetical protein
MMNAYSRVFFSLVNYILLHKRVIISKFFHSLPPKLECVLMVRPQ